MGKKRNNPKPSGNNPLSEIYFVGGLVRDSLSTLTANHSLFIKCTTKINLPEETANLKQKDIILQCATHLAGIGGGP